MSSLLTEWGSVVFVPHAGIRIPSPRKPQYRTDNQTNRRSDDANESWELGFMGCEWESTVRTYLVLTNMTNMTKQTGMNVFLTMSENSAASHVRPKFRDRHTADDGWKLQMKPRSN
ncbi:predicted protein [Histoplasma capsulatum H143]|uniref:Uncharacterized protein n=1 Tax=Ajellomyces capsulatus (strain H143) TaxID=544712 RepID=C6HCF1_AJECH|nr:predicted protein [Histoplasma capsulatum H143]